MSTNQQPRQFFRLGSFRPMQTPSQPPPPAPAPQQSIMRPAVPRFRTTAAQTMTTQEPGPAPPPRVIGSPAALTPPPTIEPTPIVAQPQGVVTNPALNSAPAPSSTPAAPTPSPAVQRFRIPAAQTTAPQETAPAAPPKQIAALAALVAPAPPPTETRPIVSQPQAPLANPTLNPSPAPSPTPIVSTPSPSLPSIVAPAPPTVAPTPPTVAPTPLTAASPLLHAPPMQPNLASSKPVSPQPRFVASPIPSSPTTKTEAVMRSSPQQAAVAAAAVAAALSRAPPTQPNLATSKPVSPQPRLSAPSPTTKTETLMRSSPQQTVVAPPRFTADKSPFRKSMPQPQAAQPASPARLSNALENSFVKKSYPDPSRTPTTTSPVRKVSLPSPEPKTVLSSRSPPPSPASSPRNGKVLPKTPPQSPLIRPLSRPPSPLTLPPPQIKTAINHEQNTLPKDHTTLSDTQKGKPKAMPRLTDTYEFEETTHNYIGQDGDGKYAHKKNGEARQSGMNVIRLVGENHGAIMELSPSRSNNNGRKTGIDYGKDNVEESSNTKNNKSMAIQAPPLTAFMNSNVQGISNSIVYNTSCTHNDPGVHLSFSRKPNGGYVTKTEDYMD